MAAATLVVFGVTLSWWHEDVDSARTMTFTTLVLVQLFHAFSSRHDRYSLFQLGVFGNPALVAAVLLSALLQVGILLSPWGAGDLQGRVAAGKRLVVDAGIRRAAVPGAGTLEDVVSVEETVRPTAAVQPRCW